MIQELCKSEPRLCVSDPGPRCDAAQRKLKSYNPNDVRNAYCVGCRESLEFVEADS